MSLFSGQKPAEPDVEAAAPAEDAPRAKHTIGALLRETRKGLNGDIEVIAKALRIRSAYLTALEEGRFDRLPAPVYALGFVRAYAIHLGLDGDEAIRRFKQEAGSFEIPRDLVFPMPLADRGIPRGPVLITAVLLLLAAYGVWYYLSSSSRVRPERVTDVPTSLLSSVGMAAPSAGPAISSPVAAQASPPPLVTPQPAPVANPQVAAVPESAPVTLKPPASAPAPETKVAAVAPPVPATPVTTTETGRIFGDAPAHIVIRVRDESWVQVRDPEGTTIFQKLMKAGDEYRVPDRSDLTLVTGNAAALDFTIDGQKVPAVSGRVRRDVRLDPALLKAGSPAAN